LPIQNSFARAVVKAFASKAFPEFCQRRPRRLTSLAWPKCRIMQTTPRDYVFGRQKSRRNSNGDTPRGAPNRGGVGSDGDFRPISRYISETV